MKKFTLTYLLALGILGAASAQDPGSGGPQPGTQDPTEIPLDGGAALLALGGGAYLLNTLRRRR